MLEVVEILSLRDWALEHLPELRELRDQNARFGWLAGQATLTGPHYSIRLNAKTTAVERQAVDLLDFTWMHPDTSWTEISRMSLPDDVEHRESCRQSLSKAEKMRAQIEGAILKAARLLFKVSNVPPPPWFGSLSATTQQTQENERGVSTASPSISEPLRHKLRRNSLDALIAKAINKVQCHDTAVVYGELREQALASQQPFTGQFEGPAIYYTDDHNRTVLLTKSALGKRLSRLKKGPTKAAKAR